MRRNGQRNWSIKQEICCTQHYHIQRKNNRPFVRDIRKRVKVTIDCCSLISVPIISHAFNDCVKSTRLTIAISVWLWSTLETSAKHLTTIKQARASITKIVLYWSQCKLTAFDSIDECRLCTMFEWPHPTMHCQFHRSLCKLEAPRRHFELPPSLISIQGFAIRCCQSTLSRFELMKFSGRQLSKQKTPRLT